MIQASFVFANPQHHAVEIETRMAAAGAPPWNQAYSACGLIALPSDVVMATRRLQKMLGKTISTR